MHSFILLEEIKLDIKVLNNSRHNNLRIYFSKYTLTHASEDPEFTPAMLPPPALGIAIGRQRQAIDTKRW